MLGSESAASRAELLCQACEIFHVWPKNYRLSRTDRFDRVLTAMRSQTFSDKNNRRNVVPVRQLASCIDKQALKFLRSVSGSSLPDRSQIAFAQFSFDFVCPLNMTRRQDQKQVGKFRSERAKNVNQNLFLAPMGATSKENWPSRINSRFPKSLRHIGQNVLIEHDVINITNGMNLRGCCTEIFPALGIFGCWHANKIEPSKNGADKNLEAPKPSSRPWR